MSTEATLPPTTTTTTCGLPRETLDVKGWVDNKQRCVARLPDGETCGAFYTAHATAATKSSSMDPAIECKLQELIAVNVEYYDPRPSYTRHEGRFYSYTDKTRDRLELTDDDDHTILNYALKGGDLRLAKILVLVCGMRIVSDYDCDMDPIFSVISGGHLHILKWIVDDLKICLIGDAGESPRDNALAIACISNQLHIVKWLHENQGAFFEQFKDTGLFCACRKGNLEIFTWLLGVMQPFDVTAKCQGKSLLSLACRSGNWELAKYVQQKSPGHKLETDAGYILFCMYRRDNFDMFECMLKVVGAGEVTEKAIAFARIIRIHFLWLW